MGLASIHSAPMPLEGCQPIESADLHWLSQTRQEAASKQDLHWLWGRGRLGEDVLLSKDPQSPVLSHWHIGSWFPIFHVLVGAMSPQDPFFRVAPGVFFSPMFCSSSSSPGGDYVVLLWDWVCFWRPGSQLGFQPSSEGLLTCFESFGHDSWGAFPTTDQTLPRGFLWILSLCPRLCPQNPSAAFAPF